MKSAECLKCGDVFRFRDGVYVCLLSSTDNRHSTTVVTALEHVLERPVNIGTVVTALQLHRSFRVDVVGSVYLRLEVIHNTDDEVLSVKN